MFCTYRILKVLASLLSPTAFALGSVNFADYERAHVGLRWSNIWRVNSVIGVLLLLIILEAFLCASKLFTQQWCRSHLG